MGLTSGRACGFIVNAAIAASHIRRSVSRNSFSTEELAQAMKQNGITKSAMAAQMQTSCARLDRLLDPDNGGVTL